MRKVNPKQINQMCQGKFSLRISDKIILENSIAFHTKMILIYILLTVLQIN